MAKISVAKFAELVGVSRVYINQLIQEGMLVRVDRKLDTGNRHNSQFLKDRGVSSSAIPKEVKKKASNPKRKKTVKARVKPPKKVVEKQPKKIKPSKKITPPLKPEEEQETEEMPDIEEVLVALEKKDIRNWSTADVGKVQKMEAALKTRVGRMKERGELIDRRAIQTVFGKLYAVDANELRTLGSKLAPKLASVFGDDDPDKLLAAERLIDDETLRTLAHIKKILNSFLRKAGAKKV